MLLAALDSGCQDGQHLVTFPDQLAHSAFFHNTPRDKEVKPVKRFTRFLAGNTQFGNEARAGCEDQGPTANPVYNLPFLFVPRPSGAFLRAFRPRFYDKHLNLSQHTDSSPVRRLLTPTSTSFIRFSKAFIPSSEAFTPCSQAFILSVERSFRPAKPSLRPVNRSFHSGCRSLSIGARSLKRSLLE